MRNLEVMTHFQYMLAPIEDMTSNAFRTIAHKYGADLTFTEMVRVQGLAKKNENTFSRIRLKDETPTVIQLLGQKEIYFRNFLKDYEPEKGFKGFNLNLGCPNPDVLELGYGCALIKRISKVKKIISIFRDFDFPISIKMRLGMTKDEKEGKLYLNLIDAVDVDFFVVHARHGFQSYHDPPDNSVYEECVKLGRDIIANGDITTKEHISFLKDIGVKGAMIGRAAIKDPSIFNKLKDKESPGMDKIREEFIQLTEKYNEPFRYRKNVLKNMGA